MNKLTIRTLFRNSVEKYSKNIALAYVGEKGISYEMLGKKVQQLSEILSLADIRAGDRIALLGENMPNWGIAYLSAVCSGYVIVPILPDFHETEILQILHHSESKLLFASQKQISRLKNILSATGIPVIEIDSLHSHDSEQDELISVAGKPFFPDEELPLQEEDLASLIYTSGTTGSSKGVMLTHRNLAWMSKQCYTIQAVNEKDRFLSVLPMSHTYENTLGFLFPLSRGASVYYLKKHPAPAVLIEAMGIVRPTTMLTVPLIIEKIYRRQIIPKFNSNPVTRSLFRFGPGRVILNRLAGRKLMETFGGKLRFFGIGGTKLDPTIEKYLREARFPYAIGYGLTETSPLLAGSSPFNTTLKSTGKAVEGVQIRIYDKNPQTGEGEIQVKGPNVMKGYYKNPGLTSQVFTSDGWFKTGDLGYMDSKGRLYICGRIKNVILGSNGENVYPEEIEEILNGIEYVEESLVLEEQGKLVALIKINLQDFENKIVRLNEKAIKVANDSIDELLAEAQKFVNQKVNRFSRIYMIRLQPVPFEKTPTNKIKRYLYGG